MGFAAPAIPAIAGWLGGAGATAMGASAATSTIVGTVASAVAANEIKKREEKKSASTQEAYLKELEETKKTSGLISNASNSAQKEYLRREKLKQGFASTIKASSGVNKLSPNNISRPALTGIATKRLLGQ